jgi:phosphate transport system ATP-binding protein
MANESPAPPIGAPEPSRGWRARDTQTPPEKLRAEHVTFRFGDHVALDDVSAPLYLNRITAFIGPSGGGKTTLLRLFNRMHDLYPDRHLDGDVFLDGRSILGPDVDARILRARVGMLFQSPAPFPFSVFENVAFGVRQYESLSRDQMRERVESALRRAALWDEVKDSLARSGLGLSIGQQQRLCLARVIAMRPEVILLDEPCSALDPRSAAKIEHTIRELRVDHTVAIVTHNLEEAARLSDYAAFIHLGRIVEFGATDQIFHAPVDPLTRRYVNRRFG